MPKSLLLGSSEVILNKAVSGFQKTIITKKSYNLMLIFYFFYGVRNKTMLYFISIIKFAKCVPSTRI